MNVDMLLGTLAGGLLLLLGGLLLGRKMHGRWFDPEIITLLIPQVALIAVFCWIAVDPVKLTITGGCAP